MSSIVSNTNGKKKTVTVVHCWSAPRSRSTALLYSFEARGQEDCIALDEPLYVDWLKCSSEAHVSRPYRYNLLNGIPPEETNDPIFLAQWQRELLSFPDRIRQAAEKLPDHGGVIFCKEMAKFMNVYDFVDEIVLEDVDLQHKHLLLLRDPVSVLASWGASGEVHGDDPKISEIGMVDLLSIYSTLHSHSKPMVVMDSDELVTDPDGVLKSICEELGIVFKASM